MNILLNNLIKYKCIYIMQTFKKKIKQTVWRMDLLSSNATFRTRKEPAYQTIFGGILSFVIMIIFAIIFYDSFLKVVNAVDIQYTQGISDAIDSTGEMTSIKFAISIEGINLSINPKQFIFGLQQINIDRGNKTFSVMKLEPCEAADWAQYGTSVQQVFTALKFEQMLCIPSDESYLLSGYAGSDIFNYLKLRIMQCNQTLDSNCDTSSNIDTFMTDFLTTNDYFNVKFYVLDSLLVPDNQVPYSYMIEKDIFMAFTDTTGTVGFIDIGQYEITTDESIWPFVSQSVLQGNFIQEYKTNSVALSSSKNYVNLNFYRSTKETTISRTLGKIDDWLSYVGGLFSLLFFVIAWFFNSYSEHCYELYVAQNTMTLDDKGRKIKQDDYGFPQYVVYSLYDWLDFFNCPPTCLTKYKAIHDTRDQICEQLDPVIILNRIRHLENVSSVLMSEHKQLCLYLSKHPTVDQFRKLRVKIEYYNGLLDEMGQKGSSKMIHPTSSEQNLQKKQKSNFELKENEDAGSQRHQQILSDQLTEEEYEQYINEQLIQAMKKLDTERDELSNKIKQKTAFKLGRKKRKSSIVRFQDIVDQEIVKKKQVPTPYNQFDEIYEMVKSKSKKNI